jgi:hypothetical protein
MAKQKENVQSLKPSAQAFIIRVTLEKRVYVTPIDEPECFFDKMQKV